ncbi:murein hydrolase activator EnvC family protein [Candidatus Vampirococcus lugosii]|uniref:Peptidase, M23 family n=1 Tax=Candidatus Vampirococcus lugosii TaxID=2789015 RepID=A0ABS5QMH2_9BACT|nr:M23 family metallopeptidase [Candidatus Vampirococcus lugosii]MBS8122343.1 Peptidase, M23 family [Candidatus Vampirococcus lugosii]
MNCKKIFIFLFLLFSFSFTFAENINKDIKTNTGSIILDDEKIESQDSNGIEFFRSKQLEIIDSIYENNTMGFLRQIDRARDRVNSLSSDLNAIVNDFENLEGRRKVITKRYSMIKTSMTNTIRSMKESEKSMSKRLNEINRQTKILGELETKISYLHKDLKVNKENLKRYTNVLYRINNDFYGKGSNIDDIKLLVNSENIANSLSGEEVIQSIALKMNDLMYLISEQEKKYLSYAKNILFIRDNNKIQVRKYQNELKNYEQQKIYLKKLFEYIKEDKDNVDSELNNLFNEKQTIENKIKTINNNILKADMESDSEFHFSELFKNPERENVGNFFSWPVNDVSGISAFFDDPRYKRKFGADHLAVDLVVEQGSEVYAPANGIVYHVVNNDGPGLNWMILVHKYGYVSVYLHMSKIVVNQGDYVKRGEIIGLSGGKPGTRGAGLLSTGPHLHFEILQNGSHVDPINYLDLSIVRNKNMLPPIYRRKYLTDSLARNTDMNNIKKITGNTVEERRLNYLRANGIGEFSQLSLWENASKNINVDIDLGICIAASESGLGKNLTTPFNVGNVGNNDRGDRVGYDNAQQGARVIYLTLSNKYLGEHTQITELSRFGNKDGTIYASSDYNWQNNVTRCLSSIKGYWIPEDYSFRKYTGNSDLAFTSY